MVHQIVPFSIASNDPPPGLFYLLQTFNMQLLVQLRSTLLLPTSDLYVIASLTKFCVHINHPHSMRCFSWYWIYKTYGTAITTISYAKQGISMVMLYGRVSSHPSLCSSRDTRAQSISQMNDLISAKSSVFGEIPWTSSCSFVQNCDNKSNSRLYSRTGITGPQQLL